MVVANSDQHSVGRPVAYGYGGQEPESSYLRVPLRLAGQSAEVLVMAVTSALIPPLCVYWRLRGAVRFRVLFL